MLAYYLCILQSNFFLCKHFACILVCFSWYHICLLVIIINILVCKPHVILLILALFFLLLYCTTLFISWVYRLNHQLIWPFVIKLWITFVWWENLSKKYFTEIQSLKESEKITSKYIFLFIIHHEISRH